MCLRCTSKRHTDNEFACSHSIPRGGDWPQSRFPDVPETPEQVSMDVPETSKASTGEPESPQQASTGEPESPKQASTGVPQTPSSSEPLASYSYRWQEGQDTAADTVHSCLCFLSQRDCKWDSQWYRFTYIYIYIHRYSDYTLLVVHIFFDTFHYTYFSVIYFMYVMC